MLKYYWFLAFTSLRRNPVLSTLMILSIGLGIALIMTAFTVLVVMARDPIPSKSRQLFAIQIDNGGAGSRNPGDAEPPTQLSWRDASALLRSHQATRESAMYETSLTVTPQNSSVKPFSAYARATTAEFFGMFDVPMLYGSTWTRADESSAAAVIVITRRLNQRLFGAEKSLGRVLRLNGGVFRIVGVMADWDPRPRFYDVIGGMSFEEGDDIYVPLNSSIRNGWGTAEYQTCAAGPAGATFAELLASECVWLQYWAELPTPAAVADYRNFLTNYASSQRRSGRFSWPPNIRLRNVQDWLVAQKVVADDAKLSVIVASTFLLCCLVCTVALMLAKALVRASEYGVRRAMGATTRAIFFQSLAESACIGVAGGLLGMCLSLLSLQALRSLFPAGLGRIAHMDVTLLAFTIVASIVATICSGIYPAWRTSQLSPAVQLNGG